MIRMAAAVAFFPVLATADVSVATSKVRRTGDWVAACRSRFEKAKSDSLTLEPLMASSIITARASDDTVAFLASTSHHHGDQQPVASFLVMIQSSSHDEFMAKWPNKWGGVFGGPNDGWRRTVIDSTRPDISESRVRFADGRSALVSQTLVDHIDTKLQSLWEMAADDCLRMK